jgi:transcriptional regulator with XRE-family HTH domain
MDKPELIGERIRELRHYRGMPLKTLAGLAGLSVGFLSMVENGKRIIDRRAHLAAVADALQVSVPELIGQPLAPVDPVHAAALASVPAIRSALVTLSLAGEHAASRGPDELRAEVLRLTPLRKNCDYVGMGRILPDLLLDLHAAEGAGDEATQRETLRLLVQATYHCTYVLKYLGFADLAMRAADLCHAAAERLGEPAWLGLAEFTRLHSLPPDSRHLVSRLSSAAADRLQPHVDDPAVQHVYGMLHLSAAMASAIALRTADVDAHLDEASDVASRIDDGPGFADMYFGRTNVGFWRVGIAVELGDGGKAPEIARGLNPELVDSPSRQGAYYADLGRGLAQTRRHDREAVRALTHAERLAPQRIRTSSAVRETVADILRRARRDAGGRELRGLAHRCAVA